LTPSMTRAQLFSRGARGGAALAVGGVVLGQFVGTAAADPLPDLDLAYARLLVAAELLASDFYGKAIGANKTGAKVSKYLQRAYVNEQEHYQSVAAIVSGAGLTPAVSSDIDFAYPKGTFDTEGSITKVALQVENLMLGAYLGAVDGLQTNPLKVGIARIAASEAQHVAYLSTIKGRPAFVAFPDTLTIDQASSAMDAFTA
jgi:ferritin-like protein